MPFTALNLITVTGKYFTLDGGGTPAVGTVTFRPNTVVVDSVNNEIVFPSLIRVELDANGSFSIGIPATDDPDLVPQGWTYVVTEEIVGALLPRTFNMEVPVNSPGATLDMADVAPATAVDPVVTYVLTSVHNTHVNDQVAHGIEDAEVTTAKLADLAVTNAKLDWLSVSNGKIQADAVTDSKVAPANKDGLVGVASMRTLGVGAQQAAVGRDVLAGLAGRSTITGGGLIQYSATGVRWSERFIVIPITRTIAPAGFWDIYIPVDGTVITGVNGAANATVAGGFIPLGAWQGLYYILPVGETSTSKPENFRISGYTVQTAEIPPHWIPIAVQNGDRSFVRFCTGHILDNGEAANPYSIVPTYYAKSADIIGSVIHGADAAVARPAGFKKVEWTGSVAPANALDNDTWVVTS